ncbi:MAG: [FeFe] hydrogenase H-cluster radical SAM maturase HydE, partial [Acutalibacteraceae bacterium]
MKNIIDALVKTGFLSFDDFRAIIHCDNAQDTEYLFSKSREQARKYYGNKIFVRGLIEFTNYCKNDCLYCGIRASNKNANRYRLSREEILDCCENGYSLGFRTFVLQ